MALLDQINAYMVLTLRLIPQDDKKAFVADLDKTVDSINNHFYNKDRNRFFGCIDNKSCFDLKRDAILTTVTPLRLSGWNTL